MTSPEIIRAVSSNSFIIAPFALRRLLDFWTLAGTQNPEKRKRSLTRQQTEFVACHSKTAISMRIN